MNQHVQISINIILHAGNAKSLCMKANMESRNYNFEQAKKYMEEAMNELTIAHQIQTELIQNECNGEGVSLNLILIHAQDHINNAMLAKENSLEFMELYKKIQILERGNMI